jgi:hypothetical protein
MTVPVSAPKPRGRKPSGSALTPAERQKRYRERQKAKLAEASVIPLRDETTRARITELNRENDALAIKVDRLARELQARDNENARLRKRLDELVNPATWQ